MMIMMLILFLISLENMATDTGWLRYFILEYFTIKFILVFMHICDYYYYRSIIFENSKIYKKTQEKEHLNNGRITETKLNESIQNLKRK